MIGFWHLLILMVVIWTAGRVFKRVGLPEVFGELLGGIIVGPAFLGIMDGDTEVITVLSELGIFFLMMHAGLKTDPEELFISARRALPIAVLSFLLPFGMGFSISALFGFDTGVSLFVGLSLSISAVALTARLFKDMQLEGSAGANIALSAAMLQDIGALILFPIVLNIASGEAVNATSVILLLLRAALFFAVVIFAGVKLQPAMQRFLKSGNKSFTLTLILALCIGLFAEYIGLHMIIGAFLAGLFIREEVVDTEAFEKIEDRYYGLCYGFFGPVFFASLAFHLDFSAVQTMPFFLFLILLAAILGKLIGAAGAARILGYKRDESLFIGLAMNNRGAVELVIASVGLQAGIINPGVFSVLVLMAFGTTILTLLLSPLFAKTLKSSELLLRTE